jgi:hypothetical protein
MTESIKKFDFISQRAVHSYLKSLAPLQVVIPEGAASTEADEIKASQKDLHAFYQALYQAMMDDPASFGLSTTPDDGLSDHEENMTQRKQELNLKLKKPRELISKALEFLTLAGLKDSLTEQGLELPKVDYAAFVGKSKPLKTMLAGMEGAGLAIDLQAGSVLLSSDRFPKMFLALKSLAQACAANSDVKDGRFNFARCDFRVHQPGYKVQPLDIYRVFPGADYAILEELHRFFTDRGYKVDVNNNDVHGWEVTYQGEKKIKASPLFEVHYSERFFTPLRLFIKCASSGRIVPVLEQQPEFLQEDFRKRVIRCGDCGWCKNSKILGPTEYTYQGETFTICWYTFPDILDVGPDTVRLVQQYALMHEGLPKLK